jgi:hypothetical protein
MTSHNVRIYCMLVLLFVMTVADAQERYAGTAIVRVDGNEYTIPIECNDATRPELGFYTEASRVTREATGRTSGVRLIVRVWKDSSNLAISLGGHVAWVPSQPSIDGVLKMTLDMSPISSLKNGMPTALTYDMWMDGERPEGLKGVYFEAQCGYRDPAAPAFKKLPASQS